MFLFIVKDISMLSMVSKTVSQHIINYISTSSGSKRLLLQDFHDPELPEREDITILDHYRSLGNLCNKIRIVTGKELYLIKGVLLYNSIRPVGNGILPISMTLLLFQCEDFPLTAAILLFTV